jgi:hypothetical protein
MTTLKMTDHKDASRNLAEELLDDALENVARSRSTQEAPAGGAALSATTSQAGAEPQVDGPGGRVESGANRLFHYTTARHIHSIFVDQEIRPATAGVPPNERPVVWFSFRQDWEPTATPLVGNPQVGFRRCTLSELESTDTPFRIKVEPSIAAVDWAAWKRKSGVHPKEARKLKAAAEAQDSNVDDYRMSFEPVAFDSWVSVEFYLDGEWQDWIEEVKTNGWNRIVVGLTPPDQPTIHRQEPVRRALPKTGANDPCPCGSGKKFRKCCRRAMRSRAQ